METIELLGVALGLGTLAGLNLYLTVFATGLAINLKWVVLAPQHAGLEVLGDPWVVTIAGVLYFLEFFADKVPWVDSLNDAVHTGIRPIGGAVLAAMSLGEAGPVAGVVAALLGGGSALTSHAAKSATRLVVNASPEPVSNIALSLGEDAAVIGGLALITLHPLVAGILALLLMILAWIFLPRLWRAMRCTAWLAWRKLNAPASSRSKETDPLPATLEAALRQAKATNAPIAQSTHCISSGGPRLPKNLPGWLIRFDDNSESLFFVARRLGGPLVVEIPIQGAVPERKTRFLHEALSLKLPDAGTHKFAFERSRAAAADAFVAALTPDTVPTPA